MADILDKFRELNMSDNALMIFVFIGLLSPRYGLGITLLVKVKHVITETTLMKTKRSSRLFSLQVRRSQQLPKRNLPHSKSQSNTMV